MKSYHAIWIAGVALASLLSAQRAPRTPSQSIKGQFRSVNQRILEMAKDFPPDKYDYRPAAGLRSFAEVLVHIASGNVYAAKAGRGENVKWDEMDPKDYKSKDQVVAMFEKSISDAQATLDATPDSKFTTTLDPWLSVIEHSAEHYGLLVAYYRNNGLVPPASRKQ